MPTYLLFDVGSTYTKGCIVDTDREEILATAQSETTATTDISEGIESVKSKMRTVLATQKIHQTLVCSSAKGGLKMVAVGLVPDLTLKAATLACYSAGAKVVGSYSFKLNTSEIEAIDASGCDILLLCGGTDGGNTEVVLHNAAKLTSLQKRFPILYAGNKSCRDEVMSILLNAGFDVMHCDNVMPSYGQLEVDSARQKIREQFLATITKAKGLTSLRSVLDDIVLPTPYSVMEALKLLSKGTNTETGLGDLMAVDIGGATTDVYSINDSFILRDNVGYKGLREPLDKRSVEGDLGVRFNASSVLTLKEQVADENLKHYVEKISNDIHYPPNQMYDTVLASWCCGIATGRHAGRLESAYTPLGVSYYQTGKDLREVTKLIGIGGPILHSDAPIEILSQALARSESLEILCPQQLDYYLDRNYVVSCLGLLVPKHPDAILRILKKNVEKINDDQ